MPKDQKHVSDAQKQRKKIKERFSKYSPARVMLQVLGTGACGAPRSLYVFSDQARYLFNCGEGTQRLAHEHKMKLAKLEHIFVTQCAWRNIGGLPGTALTIQDVGVPQLTLHGPNGLVELFRATKRFVIMKNLKIDMAECTEDSQYEDNVMRVEYVPLYKSTPKNDNGGDKESTDTVMSDASTNTQPNRRRSRSKSRSRQVDDSSSGQSSISEDDTDYYAHESKRKRSRRRSRSRSRSSSVSGSRSTVMTTNFSEETKANLLESKNRGTVMNYVCRLQPRPGALNLEKCVAHGVPAGPLLGQLKSGIPITLENGTVVKPEMVCEPDDPGPLFLVVDCPTEEYLDSLKENPMLARHQQQAERNEDLAFLVVHFTPKEVLEHPKYQAWMDNFSPSTRHMVLNELNTCMGSAAVHRIQYKLNILNDKIFPLLMDDGSPMEVPEDQVATGMNWDGLITPRTGCSFHLRPKTGFNESTAVKICPKEYVDETMSVNGFKSELSKLNILIRRKLIELTIRKYPQVLFLGTGSCIPNKTRNTSGILLQTCENNNILVDCGEGTYGQIVRFFGQDSSQQVLADINAVFISHLHADHHIGFIGLLQGRSRARRHLNLPEKPVYLFAPIQIHSWLSFYDLFFEGIANDYVLIPNTDLMHKNPTALHDQNTEIFKSLNMHDIQTCYVKHCPNAFGVAFKHNQGYKITYSGDTMPCDNLVELGMNSDLLIHEATMEDELAGEAIVKMHSTTTQAINIGQRMKAKHILLTHFSQRYAKLPRFNESFNDVNINIGIAFDNMRVKLDELPLIPLLYPALKLMFAEHYEEMEQKAVKRQIREERERERKVSRSNSPIGKKTAVVTNSGT